MQVLTRAEMDEDGAMRWLDPFTWGRRRGELERQGGPPIPIGSGGSGTEADPPEEGGVPRVRG
jgi:hypothetical protein